MSSDSNSTRSNNKCPIKLESDSDVVNNTAKADSTVKEVEGQKYNDSKP